MKEANMQETSPSLPGRACVAKSTEGEGEEGKNAWND